jgi:sortase A
MVSARQGDGSSAPGLVFLKRTQYVFLWVGLMALSYVGYVLADTQIYQAYESWQLEHSAKRGLHTLPAGLVIGKVEIPRIGLSAVVVQGDSQEILSRAVGHIPGTVLPGQSGNMVIAGHRDSFFRPLRKVHRGDRIMLKTPGGSYYYEVESTVVVAPTDLSAVEDSPQRQLTLITCYPFSWVGSAPNRFIVRARQIDSSQSLPLRNSQP